MEYSEFNTPYYMIKFWCPNCMKYFYLPMYYSVNKCGACGFDLIPIWDN